MANPWIGDHAWNAGPFVIAPPRARERLLRDGALAAPLAKKRGRVAAAEVGGDPVWVLSRKASHSRVWTFGARCAVLVRTLDFVNPAREMARVLAYHPGWADDAGYQAVRARLRLDRGGPLQLFDSGARRDSPGPRPDDPVFSFELEPGDWKASWQQVVFERRKLLLLRLVLAGHEPQIAAPGAEPAAPEPVVASSGVAAAARKLRFVSTDGGPVLLVPAGLRASWFGVCNTAGKVVYEQEPTHYDLACDASLAGVFEPVVWDAGAAWTLQATDPTAFFTTPDGGLLVRWIGADNPQSVLAAALAAPDDEWTSSPHVLHSDGSFVLLDAAADGRSLERKELARATFSLARGRYAVEVLVDWEGQVRVGDRVHDTVVQAVRLKRIRGRRGGKRGGKRGKRKGSKG